MADATARQTIEQQLDDQGKKVLDAVFNDLEGIVQAAHAHATSALPQLVGAAVGKAQSVISWAEDIAARHGLKLN